MTAMTVTEAISNFEARGIPTNSVIRAAQYIGENLPTHDQANAQIKVLTGSTIEAGDKPQRAGLVYGYLVQNVTKAHLASESPNIVELLAQSEVQADQLIEQSTWMFIVNEADLSDIENADPEVVKAGKAKKGARKVLGLRVYRDQIEGKDLTRKEAIAILQDQVGLTSAGGSTYYANFKSGKWS